MSGTAGVGDTTNFECPLLPEFLSRHPSQHLGIRANASAPRCQAKNSQDHNALKPSWTTNNPNASRALAQLRSRQTSQAATAIAIYKSVQTGPNTRAGGAQGGCSSCA